MAKKFDIKLPDGKYFDKKKAVSKEIRQEVDNVLTEAKQESAVTEAQNIINAQR